MCIELVTRSTEPFKFCTESPMPLTPSTTEFKRSTFP